MKRTISGALESPSLRRFGVALGVVACLVWAANPAAGGDHSEPFYQSGSPDRSAGGFLAEAADAPLVRDAIASGDPKLVEARDILVGQAEEQLKVPVLPVTEGKNRASLIAPSGDLHDYVSLSPYWWPNPETESGLPYVRRDGRINPERHDYDTPKLGSMGNAVRILAFAYRVTGDERYAERACEHLRTWFVDTETRMHPNLRYAQFVPGVSDGRHVGIIDTNRLRWVPDSIVMLRSSPHWTQEDDRETRRWFSEFVDWMLTSDLGREERAAENNHGTWYAAQAAQYALLAGRLEVAREMVHSAKGRIESQIEPDGSQPHELTRTRALDYCEFNLRGLMDLAEYGRLLGIDILDYKTADGRSIQQALAYLIPYMTAEMEWPYEQISPPKTHMYFQTLRRAARLYDDAAYEQAIARMPPPNEDIVWVELILPARHEAEGR